MTNDQKLPIQKFNDEMMKLINTFSIKKKPLKILMTWLCLTTKPDEKQNQPSG